MAYQPITAVGIDVSKDSNQVCILNFNQDKLASFSSPNNYYKKCQHKYN